jgi:8-hydroxy-5-deazaflavin:NADPH oxidoreductase
VPGLAGASSTLRLVLLNSSFYESPEENRMKIGIIGVGNIGSGLGNLFSKAGHEVMFSYSHDPQKIQRVVDEAGPNAQSGTPEQAARFGDVVVLAVGWGTVKEALQAAGSLDGKTLLSCVNPLTPDFTGLEVGTTSSGAEEIAKLVPGAHVVEAFLNVFAGILHSGTMLFGNDVPSVFYCGDDAGSKAAVAKLIRDIRLEPIDSGPLRNARFVEPTAMLFLQLGAFLGMAKEWKPGEFTDLSLKVLRR